MSKRPETQTEMETWLSRGWDWLADPANAHDPKYLRAEEAWLRKLAEYEQACRLANRSR